MPYKGSPCNTPTNTKATKASDSTHSEGADLLLSLAETASEHATQQQHDSSQTAIARINASLPVSSPLPPNEGSSLLTTTRSRAAIASSPLVTTKSSSVVSTDVSFAPKPESTDTRQVPVTPSPLSSIHPTREGSTSSTNNMHMSLHGSGTHMLVPSPIKLPRSEQREQPEEKPRQHLEQPLLNLTNAGSKRKPIEHESPQRTSSVSSEEPAPQPVCPKKARLETQASSPTKQDGHASPTSSAQEPLHCDHHQHNSVISPSSSQDGGNKSPQAHKSPTHVPPHPSMYRVSAPPPPHYHPGYGPPPPPQPWMHHHAPFYHHHHHVPPPGVAGYPGYYAVTVHPMPPPTGSYTAAQQQTVVPPPSSSRSSAAKLGGGAQGKKLAGEWQKTRATGGSTNRCVPLEQPTKSRISVSNPEEYEGNLPDFPLLVNYPEHLTRGQTRGTGENKGLAPEGQRHCVMCGRLRICSSSANRLNRSTAPSDSADSTVHIIPRQNKGVCTACDVTVWSVLNRGEQENDEDDKEDEDEPLEIKWCKGCKNFRPWPAFGEKGLATKCARCRHRQREKYAMQKRQNKASSSYDFQKEDDILAAQGLSNLMHAQNA